jgi:N-acetylglucosamine-6-sulfatase
MGLRIGLVAVALGVLLGTEASVATRAHHAALDERPNVVVIMTDDQTLESMRVLTNVQSLIADHGVTFLENFASYPFCCPSRATFLTGQYAHNHLVRGNLPPKGGYQALDNSNTLAVWLQDAGYHTVHVGKYLNGYGLDDPLEIPPGWSEWYAAVERSLTRYFRYKLNENGTLVSYGFAPNAYKSDVFTKKAVDAVRRLAPGGPFFLWLAYLAPHAGLPFEGDDPGDLATPVPAPRHKDAFAGEPLPMPPSFNEADMSDKPSFLRNKKPLTPEKIASIRENYQQRLESLLAVDEGVQKVVDALADTGELDQTLVIFTSDNGFLHGEHRLAQGKERVYEPSVRVPLVVRGPGVPEGIQLSQLVANVDLAPTIVQLAGATAGRTMDGRSLVPLFQNPGQQWNRPILLQSWTTAAFDAIRTPRYVYAEYRDRADRELYDLSVDPDQLVSRHADPDYADVRADLAQRLGALRHCSGSDCSG